MESNLLRAMVKEYGTTLEITKDKYNSETKARLRTMNCEFNVNEGDLSRIRHLFNDKPYFKSELPTGVIKYNFKMKY